MGQFIIHKEGVFNIYGTIADGAYFENGITLTELEEYIKNEFGEQGLRDLPGRLKRVYENGTSSLSLTNVEDMVCCNSEGLSSEEFIKKYL